MTPEPSSKMLRLAQHARLTAASHPAYTGFGTLQDRIIIKACNHTFRHQLELSVSLTFTRDDGMHACGWWKNPDYSRCEHLSIAFRYHEQNRVGYAPHDHALARVWCAAFYGARCRLLWIEPPFSVEGKVADVYHYRLFLAPDWRTPILPRKEVYTREFTEAGWKSWSELHEPHEFGEAPP